MTHAAVLARIERIRPNSDGSGQMTYCGPMHLFDGDDYWNTPGILTAWCGCKAAGIELKAVQDRSRRSPLAADLCGRCFLLPSRSRIRGVAE